MTRFDEVVQEALRERADLAVLRPVVEKELLHHDILREMGNAGLRHGTPGRFFRAIPHRVEMGTSGLIIVASSLSEILADKLIAVALREHRIKWRDVWDIAWLTQRDVVVERSLISRKAADRHLTLNTIEERINERISEAAPLHHEFVGEMNRFLPPGDLRTIVNDPRYWEYLMRLVPTLVPAG
ncbi:MAG: nucleotidyl transferase AbiEii/AbiGii toxin family protein [Alkalispirochaeta sp.]